jgi:hypothetical protein
MGSIAIASWWNLYLPWNENGQQRDRDNDVGPSPSISGSATTGQGDNAQEGRHGHWDKADGGQRLVSDDAGGDQEGECWDDGCDCEDAELAIRTAVFDARWRFH